MLKKKHEQIFIKQAIIFHPEKYQNANSLQYLSLRTQR